MRHEIVLAATSNRRTTLGESTIQVPKDHDSTTPQRILSNIKSILDSSREAFLSSQPAVLLLGTYAGRKRLLDVCQFIDRAPGPIGMSSLLDTLIILESRLDSVPVPTTVRDIYYHHVDAYKHQQQRCVANLNAVATTLHLDLRAQLLIFPLQKGLMYGSFTFLVGDKRFCLRYQDEPVLVPLLFPRVLSVPPQPTSCSPRAIIVIEKEAVFKSFCYYLRGPLAPSGLLVVTGKGFPDNLTREFITTVATRTGASIMLFVDADVYGASICLQYARGVNRSLLVYGGTRVLDFTQGWLQISRRDVCQAMCMLKSDFSGLKLLKRDVQRGLLLFLKAEMDVVQSEQPHHSDYNLQNAFGPDKVSSNHILAPIPSTLPPNTALGCARYMIARIESCLSSVTQSHVTGSAT